MWPTGQNIGKFLAGIAVIDARYIARGWVLIFGPKRRRLGDVLAKTLIVRFDGAATNSCNASTPVRTP